VKYNNFFVYLYIIYIAYLSRKKFNMQYRKLIDIQHIEILTNADFFTFEKLS